MEAAEVGAEGGEEVIEDVGLDFFVSSPGDVAGECVDFQGQAPGAALELANQKGEVLMHSGMGTKVGEDVGPEHADVCEGASVDRAGDAVRPALFVGAPDGFAAFLEVVREQGN